MSGCARRDSEPVLVVTAKNAEPLYGALSFGNAHCHSSAVSAVTRMNDQEAAGALKSTSLFGALDEESLLRLARSCRQRTYRRGQYLWYQDDVGDRLVVVCTGMVKVMLASERGGGDAASHRRSQRRAR